MDNLALTLGALAVLCIVLAALAYCADHLERSRHA